MEVTEKIKRLKQEQLERIVEARRSVGLVEFLAVNSKARSACSLRHPGWQNELLKYTNAVIEACVNQQMKNPLTMATLISAFESLGLGIIAKEDLDLDEYDRIISPCVSAFPEIIVLTQDWTPVPIDESSRYQPRVMYGPPVDVKPEKKTRAFRRTEDLEEETDVNPADLMAALAPKKKESISRDDAIKAMLAKMTKSVDPPLVKEAEAPFVETPQPDTPRFLKMVTEEGGFKLKDQDTGEYFGGKFTTPIEAIIWAAKNGKKIK